MASNKNDQHLYHSVVSTFLKYALDAVQRIRARQHRLRRDYPGQIDPNTGLPYTATDVAKAAAGGPCVPLNLFGTSNASQAAVDYAFRTLQEYSTYKQDVAAVNLRGDLFSGFGAGAGQAGDRRANGGESTAS